MTSLLHDCSPDRVFHARHGDVYRNLVELVDGLHRMPADAFVHHVNHEKNDFAAWINDVFGDSSLARQVRRSQNPITIANKISARLKK